MTYLMLIKAQYSRQRYKSRIPQIMILIWRQTFLRSSISLLKSKTLQKMFKITMTSHKQAMMQANNQLKTIMNQMRSRKTTAKGAVSLKKVTLISKKVIERFKNGKISFLSWIRLRKKTKKSVKRCVNWLILFKKNMIALK